MKIAIIGYGKMGKAVEQVALEKGHEIAAVIDSEADWERKMQDVKTAEAAIEFSTPRTVAANLNRCFDLDMPVVTGTTAWEDALPEIKARCESQSKALLVASNFSIGMNIFFRVNHHLAAMMDKFTQYEANLEETHHVKKLDTPSGTAKQLADEMIKVIRRLDSWEADKKSSPEVLPVISHRLEDVPGIHQISYTSAEDVIEIKHTAKSRAGFARGAVQAAEWIVGKTGFFTMNDFMADII